MAAHTHEAVMVSTRSGILSASVAVPNVGGTRLFTEAIAITPEDLVLYTSFAMGGSHIFNPNPLRLQRILPQNDSIVERLLDVLRQNNLTDGRIVGPAVALHSLAGCCEQQMHTDYNATDVKRCVAKPMGVILALQDGTSLCLHDAEDVHMSVGDVLVFDGDVVHAGAAYAEPNTRIHLYLDCPGVHRPTNVTYFHDDGADVT